MPKFSVSDKNKYLLMMPFLYAFISRYEWPRGYIYELVTACISGIILVAVLLEIGVETATLSFLLGYILFMLIYEIGYLTNDSYGLRHDATPRVRVAITFDIRFVVAFIMVRVVLFALIVSVTGVAEHPEFWLTYGALATLLILHNTLKAVEFKFLTFLQLSVLRFSLPILFVLILQDGTNLIFVVILTGLLLFTYPRFITYLASKNRLQLPERKNVKFHFYSYLTVLPLLLIISAQANTLAPMAVWCWLTFAQIVFISINKIQLFSWLRSFIKSDDPFSKYGSQN